MGKRELIEWLFGEQAKILYCLDEFLSFKLLYQVLLVGGRLLRPYYRYPIGSLKTQMTAWTIDHHIVTHNLKFHFFTATLSSGLQVNNNFRLKEIRPIVAYSELKNLSLCPSSLPPPPVQNSNALTPLLNPQRIRFPHFPRNNLAQKTICT